LAGKPVFSDPPFPHLRERLFAFDLPFPRLRERHFILICLFRICGSIVSRLIRLFRIGGKVVSLFTNGKDVFLLQWRYLSQRLSL